MVFHREFISRLIVATAAIHGVYSSVNTKKLAAVSGVKILPKVLLKFVIEVPVNTLKVLTTASLALNPLIKAVATLQSLKPNGVNIGAISFPIKASRLSAENDSLVIPLQKALVSHGIKYFLILPLPKAPLKFQSDKAPT